MSEDRAGLVAPLDLDITLDLTVLPDLKFLGLVDGRGDNDLDSLPKPFLESKLNWLFFGSVASINLNEHLP